MLRVSIFGVSAFTLDIIASVIKN